MYKWLWTPCPSISKRAMSQLIAFQVGLTILFWCNSPWAILPKPWEVLTALTDLWHGGLLSELMTSYFLNLEALLIATGLSLVLAWSSRIPLMHGLVVALSKLRFLSMAGLTFVFTILTRSGHQLKLSLLVWSIAVFFLTEMAVVIKEIPKQDFDLARTLKMSEWEVLWEVVILGQFDKALDVMRGNAAIGWMMLTTVESMVRSEGGVGTMLLDNQRHFNTAALFGLQMIIFLLGLGQDWSLGELRLVACPYVALEVERG